MLTDDAETAAALLAAGADVNAATAKGVTALMRAAATGNAALVQRLLDAGADVRATDSEGNTALRLADKNADVVVLLLQAGTQE